LQIRRAGGGSGSAGSIFMDFMSKSSDLRGVDVEYGMKN